MPGVTRVDLEAVLRRRPAARRSRGLIGWLSGEYQPEAPPEQLSGLAPPPNEVRREMLRLELAALEAEAQAGLAEEAALAAAAGMVAADRGMTAAGDAGVEAADAAPEADAGLAGAGMEASPDADATAGMLGESRPG
ncbi:MAG TPA: hypothetical protein VLS28_12235 [Candidatus Sulfomarinibacteraceae bacterium]|nr:hypothetical protein [Candidatus Sulfomarinibacteraceae bacterium]